MQIIRKILGIALLWSQLAAVLPGDEPARSAKSGELQIFRNQVYCTWDDQTSLHCDVFLPAFDPAQSPPSHRLPVVVMVPGGGWLAAHKITMEQHARMVCAAGLAAVTINYRLAPAHHFPAQVDDLRMAIDWIEKDQEKYRFDAKRTALFGYSAGAHLSSLIGVLADEPLACQRATSQLPADHPLLINPVRPCAVVAGGPPCDFQREPLDSRLYEFFLGGTRRQMPEVYQCASPISFASAGDSPTFFYHGTEDLLTSPADSKRFFAKQREAGVASQYQSLEKKGHMLAFIDWQTQEQAIHFLRAALQSDSQRDAHKAGVAP
jgi:acetyl esterase/lipase